MFDEKTVSKNKDYSKKIFENDNNSIVIHLCVIALKNFIKKWKNRTSGIVFFFFNH